MLKKRSLELYGSFSPAIAVSPQKDNKPFDLDGKFIPHFYTNQKKKYSRVPSKYQNSNKYV